ncbi:MAG: MATE family efflux transporter [Firmicutes bacterium]|nr:MATE family efflux transporter [Bacillota bacterium]
MAIPTIISQIIILIYNLADTYFVGRTGNPYMVAGASLILPVFNITLSVAGLAGVGGGALISRLLGEHREDEAKKVSAFCFWLSIGISVLFSTMMLLGMHPILNALGASDKTYAFARDYSLCVLVFGGIPTVLSNVMSQLLRSTGMSKEVGFGITMGGITNMFLDPLFMFVLMPKGKEILGAGIATCLSNVIACIYFFTILYRIRSTSVVRFSLKEGLPEKKSIISIFSVGIPSSVATFLFDLDYVVLDKLMVAYGDVALAAIGIVLKAERLPLNIGIGICQGMMPIVAYNYSAKNISRMKETIHFSLKVGLICAAISVTMYQIFAGNIMHMFIEDTQTVMLGENFLRIRSLATPLMFMSFFTVYIFQGFGKGNISLFLGTTRWAVFNIPMLFILNFIFGMYGLVYSQLTADILTVTMSYLVYRNYTQKYIY